MSVGFEYNQELEGAENDGAVLAFNGLRIVTAAEQPDEAEPESQYIDGEVSLANGLEQILHLVPDPKEDHQPADESQNNEPQPDDEIGTGSIYYFLNQATKTPLLTAAEEVQLSKRIQQGDQAAKEQMVLANIKLVVRFSKPYLNQGLGFDDLIQEGILGLYKAIEKFDPDKGYKFSTYAAPWLRQSFSHAIAAKGNTFRVPRETIENLRAIHRAEQTLTAKLHSQPNVSELAEEAALPIQKVQKALSAKANMLNLTQLDKSVKKDDSDTPLIEFVSNGMEKVVDAVDREYRAEKLVEAINGLELKERIVLALRFGLTDDIPRSRDEISRKMGVGRQRTKQIEEAALEKLAETLVDAS